MYMKEVEYLKKYYKGNIDDAIKRLHAGEPVQYIVGNVDFYGNIFEVDKSVLIPRFETEQLVSETYERIKNKKNLKIVDLGTGSGCIAITLSKLLNIKVDAVDISKEALGVAKKNALNNKAQVNFYLGNMLEPLNDKYDVIISNPPYIAYDEEIMDIVKNNEPHLALYADNNGLACYEKILSTCSKYLNNDALIAFEIGQTQAEAITALAHKYLKCEVEVLKDLNNLDRFIFITYQNM